MPIRKVKGGYQWGRQGKIYPTRAGAEKQAAAAYASGYKESADRCPHCGFQADTETGQVYDPSCPCPSCNSGGTRTKEGTGHLRGDEPGLRSPEFKSGDTIPKEYTADGKNISPPLRWGVPEDTVEIAIIVDDPDSPSEVPWVHWVAYGIPGDRTGIKQGEKPPKQGKNSWGTTEYRGPEPPPGTPHRYWFKVFALDTELNLEPGATKKDLIKAMRGHVIDRDALVGFYSREKKAEDVMSIPKVIQESLGMCHELMDLRGAFRLDEGRSNVHIKIIGWGGKRNIPKKQLRDFVADLKAARLGGGSAGFSVMKQTVQIPKKDIPKLEPILKKHGLRSEAPRKAAYAIGGLPKPDEI